MNPTNIPDWEAIRAELLDKRPPFPNCRSQPDS